MFTDQQLLDIGVSVWAEMGTNNISLIQKHISASLFIANLLKFSTMRAANGVTLFDAYRKDCREVNVITRAFFDNVLTSTIETSFCLQDESIFNLFKVIKSRTCLYFTFKQHYLGHSPTLKQPFSMIQIYKVKSEDMVTLNAGLLSANHTRLAPRFKKN